MSIDVSFKALRKLAIFRYGGFEFEAVCGCVKLKKMKIARNQGNELRSDNNRSRKYGSASAKAAHMVHCFRRQCSAVFDPE